MFQYTIYTMTSIFWMLIACLVGYELYALMDHRPGDTISEIMWHLSTRPLVPFLCGVLAGHFFWQRP